MTFVDAEPHATLRSRKKAETRRALHEAALGLVEAHGLDATTIERICEIADVSQRTFFNYFPSKSAAVLGLPDVIVTDEALARFRSATGELIPALCELVGEIADQSSARERIKHLIVQYPELGPAFTQWTHALRTTFGEIAEERAQPREAARFAVGLVMAALAITVHGAASGESADVEPVEPASVRLLRAVDLIVAARSAVLA